MEKVTDDNYSLKKSPYILKNLQLKLNGTDRFSSEESDFLNNVLSNCFAKNVIIKKEYFFIHFH